MFRKIVLILLYIYFVNPAFAQQQEQSLIKASTCDQLGVKLDKCKKYRCSMKHPNANKFMVEHEITGFSGDDLLCHHTQTIPGNGIIDCKYPKLMRKLMAKQAKGQKLTNDESIVISEVFYNYCKVIR